MLMKPKTVVVTHFNSKLDLEASKTFHHGDTASPPGETWNTQLRLSHIMDIAARFQPEV